MLRGTVDAADADLAAARRALDDFSLLQADFDDVDGDEDEDEERRMTQSPTAAR